MNGESRTAAASSYSTSELIPIVYEELRRIAFQQLRGETPGGTISATVLVHEAYLRLKSARGAGARGDWDGKGHFLAAAAEAMRRILVDQARRRNALKRGGERQRQEFVEDRIEAPSPQVDLVALDEALRDLDARDPGKGTLVKLIHFVGLTVAEAADALNISRATAERWWAYSRAWLFERLRDEDSRPAG